MKNSWKIIALLLAMALVILSLKDLSLPTENVSVVDSETVALENIFSRSSIRSYSDKKIENDKIEILLKAAMSAPTAGNSQPWEFFVVSDTSIIKQFSKVSKSMTPMNELSSLAIIVCGVPELSFQSLPLYWVQDCSAASENILLASNAMGLGSVWCGVHPREQRVGMVRELVGIPDNLVPLNIIMLGYANVQAVVKDKWKPERVHYVK